MKKSIKVLGTLLTGAIVVAVALLSKDDEVVEIVETDVDVNITPEPIEENKNDEVIIDVEIVEEEA